MSEPFQCRHEIPHDGPCEPRGAGRAVQDGVTQGLSPDDGLDVERLRRTLARLWEKKWGPLEIDPATITIFGAMSEEIAAEYETTDNES